MTDTVSPSSRQRGDLTVSWLAIVAVLLLAIILSIAGRGPNTLSIDRWTSKTVQRLDGQPWELFALIGNALGESTYGVPVAVILLLVAVAWRNVRDVAFLCVLLILRIASTRLKETFDSPRPTRDVVEVLETFDGFGFPSGHATTSTVALGGLAFIIARHIEATRVRWGLAVLWLLGMSITGYARIWVGAHWLTDVVGGSLYGIGIVLIAANISAMVAAWVRERRHRQTRAIRS